MLELMDPESGWRVVACTEIDVKTAAFVLMEVYDNFGIWALSLHMLNAIKTFGIDVGLVSRVNVCDIWRLFKVMDNTNFLSLPSEGTLRGAAV